MTHIKALGKDHAIIFEEDDSKTLICFNLKEIRTSCKHYMDEEHHWHIVCKCGQDMIYQRRK